MSSTSLFIRHVPTALETKRIEATGAAVVCKGGGWPTHRIHWTAPSSQAQRDEMSEPLVTGKAYLPPSGKFTEFWITCERLAFSKEDILLEVLSCATPVIVMNERPVGYDFHHVSSETPHEEDLTESQTATILYRDNPLVLDTTIDTVADTNRTLTRSGAFIGGGVSAEAPFILRMFGKIGPGNSYKALLAEWQCDLPQAYLDGRYSCRFEYGGRPSYRASSANTHAAEGMLLWPMWGLEVLAYRMTADVIDMHWTLLEIKPR